MHEHSDILRARSARMAPDRDQDSDARRYHPAPGPRRVNASSSSTEVSSRSTAPARGSTITLTQEDLWILSYNPSHIFNRLPAGSVPRSAPQLSSDWITSDTAYKKDKVRVGTIVSNYLYEPLGNKKLQRGDPSRIEHASGPVHAKEYGGFVIRIEPTGYYKLRRTSHGHSGPEYLAPEEKEHHLRLFNVADYDRMPVNDGRVLLHRFHPTHDGSCIDFGNAIFVSWTAPVRVDDELIPESFLKLTKFRAEHQEKTNRWMYHQGEAAVTYRPPGTYSFSSARGYTHLDEDCDVQEAEVRRRERRSYSAMWANSDDARSEHSRSPYRESTPEWDREASRRWERESTPAWESDMPTYADSKSYWPPSYLKRTEAIRPRASNDHYSSHSHSASAQTNPISSQTAQISYQPPAPNSAIPPASMMRKFALYSTTARNSDSSRRDDANAPWDPMSIGRGDSMPSKGARVRPLDTHDQEGEPPQKRQRMVDTESPRPGIGSHGKFATTQKRSGFGR